MNDELPEKASRLLIVNADDFGLSHGINRGIIHAHVHGLVTSTSLMVRGPAAVKAAELAREHPALSVGLHVDMGEWNYCDGDWKAVYEVLPPDASAEVVEAEVQHQLANFREITGSDPTHFDSHQHVHRDEPLRSILTSICASLGVPLRHCESSIAYCGAFYGQADKAWPNHEAISAGNLCHILQNLPAGMTELACHPGLDGDYESVYRMERPMEVAALCDPAVLSIIRSEGITLCSFREAGANVR